MRNYWRLAITVSLLFHTAIFIGVPGNFKQIFVKKNPVVKNKIAKEITITPQQIEKIVKRPLAGSSNPKPLPYIENIMNKLMQSDDFSPLQKPQIFEKNIKEIVFKDIAEKADKALKKNPAYMSYYRLIRERIRTSAYLNYNIKKKGEVSLNFLVENDGSLKGVDLAPQSVKSRDLRKIALKSVQESAPFPEFPEGLQQYSRLQFSISIYFKNK